VYILIFKENCQKELLQEYFNSDNIEFNPEGIDPGLGADDGLEGRSSFDYPEGEWFKVSSI
jgi:hypothetical protein